MKVFWQFINVVGSCFLALIVAAIIFGNFRSPSPSFLNLIASLLLLAWLLHPTKRKFISSLPAVIQLKLQNYGIRFSVGFALFFVTCLTIPQHADTKNQIGREEASTAKDQRDLEDAKQKRLAKIASMREKRDLSLAEMKRLFTEQKYGDAVQLANQFALLNDQEINDLKTAAKSEIDRIAASKSASNTFANAETVKANSQDCTLITKFSFGAAEAYAKGIPKDRFVSIAHAGFMRGHKEFLDDPRASVALVSTLEDIYDDMARMGAALHIGGSMQGDLPPSETVRKHLSALAQLQLGRCVGRDDRSRETKSEACVDAALTNAAKGNIPFKDTYIAFGKCGNGSD